MKYKLRENFTHDAEFALEEILRNRGVKDVDNFMYPTESCELSALDLKNIDLAADMLLKHLRANNEILLIIDADTDGFTSSAILWLYIKHIFPQAKLSFTIHEHKQHGLDDKINWIEEQNSFQLIICPDAASFDLTEHHTLHDLGIDCICLDHHMPPQDDNGNDILPNDEWAIVVNNQLSPSYLNKSLCGAGVVYKFCEFLDQILGIKQAQEYMDLVALGEIADVMDRTDTETNYLIMEGLQYIQNKGFQTLIESQSYSLKEKAVFPYNNLTPIDVAFYIAPLINAITRVGSMQEKEAMFYCFIEPNKLLPSTKRGAKSGETETAAEQTARVGKNAKSRQDKIKDKALDLIDFKIQKNNLNYNNVIIVEIDPEDNIPQEISGLIAMAVVTKYNRPCLILRNNSNNLLQGSARTNSNFLELSNFKSYLENSGYFEYASGHEGAFGAGIKAANVSKFIAFVNKNLSTEAFENCYIVDYILDARENDKQLLYALAAHPEYFGNHIDEVKIIIQHISLANIMVMGQNKDSIKISYNGIDYVKFKDNDFIEKVFNNRMNELTILARININEWQGKKSLQCFISDYEFITPSNKYDF